jgi:uncharacterized repeat protein (TIGR03803 family)
MSFRSFFVTCLLISAVASHLAQAQNYKFKVLHTFHGKDGNEPDAQLLRDQAGNMYGTTGEGGANQCGNIGCGTAFEMNKDGKILWLHSFNGQDGETPFPGLLRDASGNLYGTTIYGGTVNHACGSSGCGLVFKLNKAGRETVLHKFNGIDGITPVGPLVEDGRGILYGATQFGSNGGTVFSLNEAGKENTLYSFGCGSDGCDPGAGVILDEAGNIYGTTFDGGDMNCNPGQGCGVVFQLSPRADGTWRETVLHTFEGTDGWGPTAPLLLDSAGNLYGTTENGGNLSCAGGTGCGVVFELSPSSNGTWTETVLYAFCSKSDCTDGNLPGAGSLVRDPSGNLYGTTIRGGHTGCGQESCGVVYKLDASGNETILYNFASGADGYDPLVGVTRDTKGNLYGTALFGGAQSSGTAFEITP